MYNLFHASDPAAFRLEPLLNFVFRQIPPIKIARYSKFPMGDGESIQIGKETNYKISSVKLWFIWKSFKLRKSGKQKYVPSKDIGER